MTLDLKLLFEKAEALTTAGHVRKLIVAHFPSALPALKRVLYTLAKRKDLATLSKSPIADRITRFDTLSGDAMTAPPP